MAFIDEIKQKAKKDIKTIILPESEDKRVLDAASKVLKEKFANIILIGDEKEILDRANENKIDLTGCKIINPKTSDKFEQYGFRFTFSVN